MDDWSLLSQVVTWYKGELSDDGLRVAVNRWLRWRNLLPKHIRILKDTKNIPGGLELPILIESEDLVVVNYGGVAYGFKKADLGVSFEFVENL